MFCPKCGASASGAFCNTCGAPMGQPIPAPAPPPQAYEPPPRGYPPPPPPPPYAPPYTPGTAPVYPGGPVFDYAQWGTRALGYIIDMLIVCVVVVPIYFLFGVALAGLFATMAHSDVGGGISSMGCCMFLIIVPLVSLLVGLYNSVYLVYTRGFSIGQGVVKIKVVSAQGQLLSGGTAFLRLLIRVVFQFIAVLSILDMLWPLWDERRQTLHDKIVNSYVINNPSGT